MAHEICCTNRTIPKKGSFALAQSLVIIMKNGQTDTIAAIATPPGVGGLGVIRISGPAAFCAVDKIFRRADGHKLEDAPSHTLHYGHVIDPESGAVIDEAMAAVMRAPRTFTAEDVVELSTHGSPTILQKTLLLLLRAGVRMAQAGEFTKRAFLNGRIDLSRAEAVLDVIHADSDVSLKNAINQLEGGLAREIERIRQPLLYAAAQFAAAVDYPDDEIADLSEESLRKTLSEAEAACATLLANAESGRIAKEGLRCVLAGKPNVGKSSLLNVLTRSERAIVTDVAGTTRDVIEESVAINGIALRLYDTAGLRDTGDVVEQIGVERTRTYLENADLVLLLLDSAEALTDEDFEILALTEQKKRILVVNKSDLGSRFDESVLQEKAGGSPIVTISAAQQTGIDALKQAIVELCSLGPVQGANALVSNLRHVEALSDARESLRGALQTLDAGMPMDMCSIDLSAALESLGLITGASVSADIVDKIFAEFCVGK